MLGLFSPASRQLNAADRPSCQASSWISFSTVPMGLTQPFIVPPSAPTGPEDGWGSSEADSSVDAPSFEAHPETVAASRMATTK
jgi:hypothetical protein